jgi:hypothetical protein
MPKLLVVIVKPSLIANSCQARASGFTAREPRRTIAEIQLIPGY